MVLQGPIQFSKDNLMFINFLAILIMKCKHNLAHTTPVSSLIYSQYTLTIYDFLRQHRKDEFFKKDFSGIKGS